jgi:hypothetical protein
LLGALFGLSIFLAVLALASPLISKLCDVKSSLAFALTPILYIAWNLFIHDSLFMLGSAVRFTETLKISLFSWLLISLVSIIYFKSRRQLGTELEIKGFVTTALCLLVSLVTWLVGIGTNFLSPADNDSLSNAFISTRMLSQENDLLCVISSDPTRNINLRFESCGAFVLTHSSNFLNLISNDRAISIAFLFVAIFLPLGAMIAYPYFGGARNRRWIAGMTSICFLLFPYGLNGLLRLSVSLALLLPVLALISDRREMSLRRVVLLAISFVGIGYVHLLALVVVMAFYLVTSTISFLFLATETKNRMSLISTLRQTLLKAMAIAPSYFIFFQSEAISGSTKNVLNATKVTNSSPDILSSRPILESTENQIVGALRSFSSLCRTLLFETEWTRPQPILALVTYLGLIIVMRNMPKAGVVFSSLIGGLLTLFFGVAHLNIYPWIYQSLFLNDWYRLVAVLQILCIIPAAFGVDYFLSKIEAVRRIFFSRLLLALLPLASIGTGASIVRTAWSNDRLISPQALNQLNQLRPWANLRTLNNPSDGSAWAYSRIGMNIASPNDRGGFMDQGILISNVRTKDDAQRLQAVIVKEDAEAVLGINANADNIRKLDDWGLISAFIVNEPGLVFALLKR